MIINRKNARLIGFQIILLMMTFCIFTFFRSSIQNHNMFLELSAYGLIIIIALVYTLYKVQGTLICILNVFFVMFVIFQFGLPITYVFSPNHYNYYFNLFSTDIHIEALEYTIYAIQLFCLGLTIGLCKKEKHVLKGENGRISKKILNNSHIVSQAALILYIFTALLAIPLNFHAALGATSARLAGANIGIAYRGTMSENAFLRFVQEFFFSSGLLYLCFSNKSSIKKAVSVCYVAVSLMLVIVADRNAGITSLIVFAFFIYYTGTNKNSLVKKIAIILAIMIIGVASVYVAQQRLTDAGLNSVLQGNVFISAIEEMGFNFTSICFVMSYIPRYDSFKYGLSYLASFFLLIPKSFDFLNLYPNVQSVLGETWLWNMNNSVGRTNLSFGVGFSMIAESYYNFAWFGLVIMIPLALIVTYFFRERKEGDNPWRLYIRLVLMLGFFTLPRRQFASMLKSIEYSVFFIAIYLVVFIEMFAKSRSQTRMGKLSRQ